MARHSSSVAHRRSSVPTSHLCFVVHPLPIADQWASIGNRRNFRLSSNEIFALKIEILHHDQTFSSAQKLVWRTKIDNIISDSEIKVESFSSAPPLWPDQGHAPFLGPYGHFCHGPRREGINFEVWKTAIGVINSDLINRTTLRRGKESKDVVRERLTSPTFPLPRGAQKRSSLAAIT